MNYGANYLSSLNAPQRLDSYTKPTYGDYKSTATYGKTPKASRSENHASKLYGAAAPRKSRFLTDRRKKEDSDGYETDSSDSYDENPRKFGTRKTARKRTSQKNKVDSVVVKNHGVKKEGAAAQGKDNSSSDEDTHQSSLEGRMRARRRRLQKSKALLMTENFCPISLGLQKQEPEAKTSLRFEQPPFSIKKVYLQPLQPKIFDATPNLEKKESFTQPPSNIKNLNPVASTNTSATFMAAPDIIPTTTHFEVTPSDTISAIVNQMAYSYESKLSPCLEVKENSSIVDSVNHEELDRPNLFNQKNRDINEFSPSRKVDLSSLNDLEASWHENMDMQSSTMLEKMPKETSSTESSEGGVVEPAYRGAKALINAFTALETEKRKDAARLYSTERLDRQVAQKEKPRYSEPAAVVMSDCETIRSKGGSGRSLAKKLVVLHTDAKKTTTRKEADVPPEQQPANASQTQSTNNNNASTLTQPSCRDNIFVLTATRAETDRPSSSTSFVEILPDRLVVTPCLNHETPSRPPPSKIKIIHHLPSIDKEITDLLSLGEELNASRVSLQSRKSSATSHNNGSKAPEVSHGPQPQKALIVNSCEDMTLTGSIDSLNAIPKPWKPALGFLPGGQHVGSAESLGSLGTFRTAPSEGLGSRDSLNTWRRHAQPFQYAANSSDNLHRLALGRQKHEEPFFQHSLKKRQLAGSLPVLRRTSSETSADSWVSSIDKQNNLDFASQKVDEMIHKARQKHQQRKSRVREAMDYRGEICEDIKKEAEDATVEKSISDLPPRFKPKSDQPPAVLQRPAQTKVRASPVRNQGSYWAVVGAPPHVSETVSDNDAKLTYDNNKLKGTLFKDSKYDFTKRWLENDLHSLTKIPMSQKPDLLQFGPQETDLHSIGSASAEVAAIIDKDSRVSARPIPDLVPQKHKAVVKPSPLRYANYADVNKPPPVPDRKDSLSSVDSARQMVGKFLNKVTQHEQDSEKQSMPHYSSYQAGGMPNRPQNYSTLLNSQQASQDRLTRDSGLSSTDISGHKQLRPMSSNMSRFVKRFESYDQLPASKGLLSSDDESIQQLGSRRRQHRYAESTHSLPVNVRQVPLPWKGHHTEWKTNSGTRTPTTIQEYKTLNASGSTLTDLSTRGINIPRNPPKKDFTVDNVDSLVAELQLNTEEYAHQQRRFPTNETVRNGFDMDTIEENQYKNRINPQQFLTNNLHNQHHEKDKVITAQLPVNKLPAYQHMQLNSSESSDITQKKIKDSYILSPYRTPLNGYRSPFEVINEERLNESRVESIKNVFEPPMAKEHPLSPTLPELAIFKKAVPIASSIPAPVAHRPISLQPIASTAYTNERSWQQTDTRLKSITSHLQPVHITVPSEGHPSSHRISNNQSFGSFSDDDRFRSGKSIADVSGYDKQAFAGKSYDNYNSQHSPSENYKAQLRQTNKFKIDNVVLGQDSKGIGGGIRNFFRKLTNQSRSPLLPPHHLKDSTVSLVDPPESPKEFRNIHKSNSTSEAHASRPASWQQSLAAHQLSQNQRFQHTPERPMRIPVETAMFSEERASGRRRFPGWAPWKKLHS